MAGRTFSSKDAFNYPAGGVESFNSRTGAITPLQSDYDAFFLTASDLGVISVVDYGADPTGVADSGAAITAAAAALSAQGGGTLLFPPGEYLLFNSAGGNIVALSGLTGVRILGYGATLAVSTTNAGTLTIGYGAIFRFTNCKNVFLDGFNVTGPDVSSTFAGGSSKGINVVQLDSGNEGFVIPNLIVSGVQAAFIMPNTLASAMNKRIWIGNLKVTNSYYGICGYYGIDGVRVENLVTDTIYRSVFMYGGVYNVSINVRVKNNESNDVILLTSTSGGITAGLENIHIKYVRGTDSTDVGAGGFCLYWGWGDENPASIRNISFDIDVAHAAAGDTGPGVMKIIKQTAAGAGDTVDRGHTLYGLRISGTITGTPSVPSGAAIQSESTARWGNASDKWFGVTLKDLYLSTTSIRLDVAAVDDILVLNRVSAPAGVVGLLDFSNSGTARQDQVSQYARIEATEVHCLNALDYNTWLPLLWRSDGNSPFAISAAWAYGTTITNRLNAVVATYTLPAAVRGMDIQFFNTSASLVNFRVDPDGTEVIYGGGAGKYLEIPVKGSARIVCGETGKWQIVSSYGTLTFEP